MAARAHRRREAEPVAEPVVFLPRQLAPFGIGLILLAALVLAVLGLRGSSPPNAPARVRTAAARPPVPPPAIEPLVLLDMTPDRARAINGAIPFARGPNPPARPFRFEGGEMDRQRALTCLAAAAWYEAGDDAVGQRAVVQVVLNRLRHPAYPKTVCAVVFQGAERTTGCQFTFTCDGALARRPSEQGWARARAVAEKALDGFVDKAVGTATHYHTDWVVPYWSGSLDKIAAVHTHLFFRWPGWWGQPAAFSGRYAGGETLDPRLLYLAGPAAAPVASPAEQLAAEATAGEDATPAERPVVHVEGVSARMLKGNVVRLANEEGSEFGLELAAHGDPAGYAAAAAALCKARPACIVAGWIRPELIPAKLPVPVPALRTVTFLYRKNEQVGRDQSLWNCRQVPRDDAAQCLPGTGPVPSG